MKQKVFTLLTVCVVAIVALLICSCKGDAPIAYIDFSYMWKNSPRDKEKVVEMWDILHATSTLQGIVNRESPQIYINYVHTPELEADRFWWNYYRAEGRWLAERDTVVYSDVVKSVENY